MANAPSAETEVLHPYFTQLTDAQIRAQVQDAQQAILRANGADTRPLFRFPYGDVNSRVIADVNGLGYVPVRWTVDSLGWEGTSGGQTGRPAQPAGHDRAGRSAADDPRALVARFRLRVYGAPGMRCSAGKARSTPVVRGFPGKWAARGSRSPMVRSPRPGKTRRPDDPAPDKVQLGSAHA